MTSMQCNGMSKSVLQNHRSIVSDGILPLFLLQSAQSNLKSEYKDGMDTEAALELGVKVLMKTIDSAAPTSENMELATLTVKDGRVVQSILAADKVNALIKKVIDGEAASGDV